MDRSVYSIFLSIYSILFFVRMSNTAQFFFASPGLAVNPRTTDVVGFLPAWRRGDCGLAIRWLERRGQRYAHADAGDDGRGQGRHGYLLYDLTWPRRLSAAAAAGKRRQRPLIRAWIRSARRQPPIADRLGAGGRVQFISSAVEKSKATLARGQRFLDSARNDGWVTSPDCQLDTN